jgi:protein-S-isoprenylcysteine O-methyltransferase Ste14
VKSGTARPPLGSDTPGATPPSKRLAVTSALSFLYLLSALACLLQWNTAHLWERVDYFSGSYLALRAVGAVHSVISSRRAFRSKQVRREWWGETSNRGIINWVILLMLGDLTVFLDYGHWHTLPALERPGLKGMGLAVYLLAAVWQMWTDSYLAKYFSNKGPDEAPITDGPFRYVRHPRYAAAIAGKLAFALVFASLLGWLLALAWTILLVQKVRAEEAHLRELFGARYEAYAEKTTRLLPGIY